MEQHGGKGAPRRLGKNPFTLTCCLDRQRAEKCGSRLQCRILVNAARAPVGTLRHFDAHAANLVAAAVKCARRATGTDCCAQQVKSDCGRTACLHSTEKRAGTYRYKEILVGRVCWSYRTIQLVPTQAKVYGPTNRNRDTAHSQHRRHGHLCWTKDCSSRHHGRNEECKTDLRREVVNKESGFQNSLVVTVPWACGQHLPSFNISITLNAPFM